MSEKEKESNTPLPSIQNPLDYKLYTSDLYSIKNQIIEKQKDNPRFSTLNDAEKTITDFDHFPYTRFYRGVPNSPNPIVIEREAGWRPQRNECYNTSYCSPAQDLYPNHCFRSGCSVVLPCYQPDIENKDTAIFNQSCIVQYR